MPRIYVKFSGLQQLETTCSDASATLSEIQSDFQKTVRQLDWDVRLQSDINRTASRLSGKLSSYTAALKKYQSFLNDAHSAYQELDVYQGLAFATPDPDQTTSYGFDWKEVFKDALVVKSYAAPGLLALVSAATGLSYITSGIYVGKDLSVVDESRTPSASASADWLGYETPEDKPEVTAWVGKANAEAQNEVGYAGVNAYLGKAEASAGASVDIMKSGTKKENTKGKTSQTDKTEFIAAAASASVVTTALAGDAAAGVGSDMLGVEGKVEGSVGKAKAEAKGQFSVGEDGVNMNLKGETMVSAVEGEASGTINILGLEITGKVGGYAGAAGIKGKVGIEDNKFVLEGGAAALLGGSVGIEIGFNEEGWDNFVDFLTFWD